MATKNYLLFLLTLFLCGNGLAQVRFDHTDHDLGTIPEDTVRLPHCDFAFTNKGKQPIALSKIKTSCGCLHADFDSRPVQTGQTGHIRITFDPAGHPGRFLRKITVHFNNRTQPYILQIKGTVVPAQRPGQRFPRFQPKAKLSL